MTGAESGIGAACAVALARAGCDVAVLYYRDADAAGQTVARVKAAGREGLAVQADVGNEALVEAAFDQVHAALDVPEILINSAGLNQSGVKVADMSLAQ